MQPVELHATLPRYLLLAVGDNELFAHALRRALCGRYDVIIAPTRGDALTRIARGTSFDVVLCDLPVKSALELHAAIAHRDPFTAGRVLVLHDTTDVQSVIAAVLAI
jgi:DNA-binding NarL/FixJ family response regulator